MSLSRFLASLSVSNAVLILVVITVAFIGYLVAGPGWRSRPSSTSRLVRV